MMVITCGVLVGPRPPRPPLVGRGRSWCALGPPHLFPRGAMAGRGCSSVKRLSLGSVLLDLQEVLKDLMGGLGGLPERSFMYLLGGHCGLSRCPGGSLGCPKTGSSQKVVSEHLLTVGRNLVEMVVEFQNFFMTKEE